MIKKRVYFIITMINKHIQAFNSFQTVAHNRGYGKNFHFKKRSYLIQVNNYKHVSFICHQNVQI